MINDSTNVRTIADNIRKLEKMVKEAGSELPTPGAGDTGKILKVGSDGYELATEYSYTPPAYSSTDDVDTGSTWIDGKKVYSRVYTGMTGTTGNVLVTDREDIDTFVSIEPLVITTTGVTIGMDGINMIPRYTPGTGLTFPNSATAVYQETPYFITIRFTKKSLSPSTETKKKTTKKG